jgi:solute carrier family 25 oxoglutarate transporter 11
MASESKPKPALSPIWTTVKPFLNGGLSGMAATCVIQPIDMVKVRVVAFAFGNDTTLLAIVLIV